MSPERHVRCSTTVPSDLRRTGPRASGREAPQPSDRSSRRISGWSRRSQAGGIAGKAITTSTCDPLGRTRPCRARCSRWTGLGRERPRWAAVASRSRSATAPGPRSADHHRMATGWVRGCPRAGAAGNGLTNGRCCAVRRKTTREPSAVPGVGAESIAMGGRASRRRSPGTAETDICSFMLY